VTWFPYDEQICTVVYESYTLSTNLLNMTASSNAAVPASEYQDTGEWTLLGMNTGTLKMREWTTQCYSDIN